MEAYNGVIGKAIEKNGNFFKFVQVIRKEEFFKSRHFNMLCNSGPAVKRRKRRSFKESLISNGMMLLEEGKITVSQFLDRMVDTSNGIDSNALPPADYEDEAVDSDAESAIEDQNSNDTNRRLCVICQENTPTIVLLPCKHLVLCDACNLKLQADAITNDADGYQCPCCRSVVQDNMQVYI